MDVLALKWPYLCLYAFPPVALLPQVISQIWEEACAILLVPGISPATVSCSVAHTFSPRQEGRSGTLNWSCGTCVCGPSTGSINLPQNAMRTISKVRAPSTRRLYAQKLSIFSSWCLARKLGPTKCGSVSVQFLQEMLDSGHGTVESLLQISVWRWAGPRRLLSSNFITWTSLLFKHGCCQSNCLCTMKSGSDSTQC